MIAQPPEQRTYFDCGVALPLRCPCCGVLLVVALQAGRFSLRLADDDGTHISTAGIGAALGTLLGTPTASGTGEISISVPRPQDAVT